MTTGVSVDVHADFDPTKKSPTSGGTPSTRALSATECRAVITGPVCGVGLQLMMMDL